MRCLLFSFALAIGLFSPCFSQITPAGEEPLLTDSDVSDGCDTLMRDSLSAVNGHVVTTGHMTTLGSVPRYVKLPNVHYRIYQDPNYLYGVCELCGCFVSIPVMPKPDTTVIWRDGVDVLIDDDE